MRTCRWGWFGFLAMGIFALPLGAAQRGDFGLAVVVDGEARPEYPARGKVYVEALRNREYVLRISNPFPYRVAAALSVDGLNTLDARRTDPWTARKWVIEPYGSIVIPGWQVNGSTARSFYFTGEKHSYGAWLGKTDNLGVIEAVFFREKQPPPLAWRPDQERRQEGIGRRDVAPMEVPSAEAPGPARPDLSDQPRSASGTGSTMPRSEAKSAAPSLSDDYAATGMGGHRENDVETVFLDLDRSPVATVRIRYEFRSQLVRLGVLPRWSTPMERREGASGFSGSYCPQPDR